MKRTRRQASEAGRITRLMAAHERALERDLSRILDSVARRIAQQYRQNQSTSEVENLAGMMLRPLVARLVHTAREAGRGLWMLDQPKQARGLEVKFNRLEQFEQAIVAWLTNHALRRARRLTEHTRTVIRRVILRADEEGVGTEAIARRIQSRVGGEFGRRRARVIARTETHTAAMVGQEEAAKASGIPFEREWLSTEDARVRASHAAANGQRRPPDVAFSVGGSRLMFPGDPSGPAREVINCRCVLLYHPNTEG